MTANIVRCGAYFVVPVVRDDWKGEKFGQFTSYQVRCGEKILARCDRAEDAAEIALALSEWNNLSEVRAAGDVSGGGS